jgi:hypothetical protein
MEREKTAILELRAKLHVGSHVKLPLFFVRILWKLNPSEV